MEEKKQTIRDRMMSSMEGINEKEASDFINEFLETVQEPVKRVPENVFREIFLPVFAGTGQGREKDTQNFIAHWCGIVGSGYSEAEVYNIRGELLFKVPPIFNSENIHAETQKGGSKSYEAIFNQYIDDAAVNQTRARHEIAARMANRLETVIDTAKPDSAVEQWDIIFKHYGLVKKDQPKDTSASKTIDEDFEF